MKVLLRNGDNRLRPGMAVSAEVALPKRSGVLIPQTAFTDDNHDTILTVGSDSTVHTVKVSELSNDGRMSVVSGLPPGSRVVRDGQTSVGEGEKVAIH